MQGKRGLGEGRKEGREGGQIREGSEGSPNLARSRSYPICRSRRGRKIMISAIET